MRKSGHASREQMERFFRLELPGEEAQEIVRHLVSRCAQCVSLAEEVGRISGFLRADEEPENGYTADPESYTEAFLRVLGQTDDEERRLAHERLRAIGQWSELEELSPAQRLLRVRNEERFHNWGLFERLLDRYRELCWQDPVAAVDVSHLALAVVETFDPQQYGGAARISDLRTSALAAVGNAKRLASDLDGAARAFEEAWEALSLGTGDPLEEANLIGLQASLLRSLGEPEKATELLEKVIGIYQKAGDLHLVGRTLLKQSDAIGSVDPLRGVELAQNALALIDPVREPRLEVCARHNVIWFLTHAGKYWEALAMLETSRPLYQQFPDTWPRLSLRWVEGRIARGLGDLEEAEHTFERLREEMKRRDLIYSLTLLCLDLAEVHVARGKLEQATEVDRDHFPLLRSWGLHTEGLALWMLLRDSLAARTIQEGLFRQMGEYLHRAWLKPLEGREDMR